MYFINTFIIINILFKQSSQKKAKENLWSFYQLSHYCFLLGTCLSRLLFLFFVDLFVAYRITLLVSLIRNISFNYKNELKTISNSMHVFVKLMNTIL